MLHGGHGVGKTDGLAATAAASLLGGAPVVHAAATESALRLFTAMVAERLRAAGAGEEAVAVLLCGLEGRTMWRG